MPQVSRRQLSKQVEQRLFVLFFKSFAKLSRPTEIQKFLYDLLSPTEQTMLAKRLAIALLLAKGYTYEAIKDILKVSQETISRVNVALNHQGEGYRMVIQKAFRDEKLGEILEKVENVTIELLPLSPLKKSLQAESRAKRKPKTALG